MSQKFLLIFTTLFFQSTLLGDIAEIAESYFSYWYLCYYFY